MSIKRATNEQINEKCRHIIDRIRNHHLREWEESGKVFYISDTYPAVWMEHTYDSLIWAMLSGENEIAVNETMLFINKQREDEWENPLILR